MKRRQLVTRALLLSALIAYSLLEEISQEEEEPAPPRPKQNENPVVEIPQDWGGLSQEQLARIVAFDQNIPDDTDVSD